MPKPVLQIENSLNDGLKEYFKGVGITENDSKNADFIAKSKTGLSLLNWIVNGSAKESVVPPIKDGILRGSGSVFVGNKIIGDLKGQYPQGTPNRNISEKNKDVITVGFNTSYAARMHEHLEGPGASPDPITKRILKPGERSIQSGDVAGKFVERHLQADGKDSLAIYAKVLKKESGG